MKVRKEGSCESFLIFQQLCIKYKLLHVFSFLIFKVESTVTSLIILAHRFTKIDSAGRHAGLKIFLTLYEPSWAHILWFLTYFNLAFRSIKDVVVRTREGKILKGKVVVLALMYEEK